MIIFYFVSVSCFLFARVNNEMLRKWEDDRECNLGIFLAVEPFIIYAALRSF